MLLWDELCSCGDDSMTMDGNTELLIGSSRPLGPFARRCFGGSLVCKTVTTAHQFDELAVDMIVDS